MVVYDGDDLAEYVISANVARRHMSTGARAMSTALVLAEDGRRQGNGRWAKGSVDIGKSPNMETWRDALKRAGLVLDQTPELAPLVVSGEVTLNAAHERASQARDAERARRVAEEEAAAEEAEARAFVEEAAPDLAALVGDTLQSYLEARDVWQRRNREEAERLRREKAALEKRLDAALPTCTFSSRGAPVCPVRTVTHAAPHISRCSTAYARPSPHVSG